MANNSHRSSNNSIGEPDLNHQKRVAEETHLRQFQASHREELLENWSQIWTRRPSPEWKPRRASVATCQLQYTNQQQANQNCHYHHRQHHQHNTNNTKLPEYSKANHSEQSSSSPLASVDLRAAKANCTSDDAHSHDKHNPANLSAGPGSSNLEIHTRNKVITGEDCDDAQCGTMELRQPVVVDEVARQSILPQQESTLSSLPRMVRLAMGTGERGTPQISVLAGEKDKEEGQNINKTLTGHESSRPVTCKCSRGNGSFVVDGVEASQSSTPDSVMATAAAATRCTCCAEVSGKGSPGELSSTSAAKQQQQQQLAATSAMIHKIQQLDKRRKYHILSMALKQMITDRNFLASEQQQASNQQCDCGSKSQTSSRSSSFQHQQQQQQQQIATAAATSSQCQQLSSCASNSNNNKQTATRQQHHHQEHQKARRMTDSKMVLNSSRSVLIDLLLNNADSPQATSALPASGKDKLPTAITSPSGVAHFREPLLLADRSTNPQQSNYLQRRSIDVDGVTQTSQSMRDHHSHQGKVTPNSLSMVQNRQRLDSSPASINENRLTGCECQQRVPGGDHNCDLDFESDLEFDLWDNLQRQVIDYSSKQHNKKSFSLSPATMNHIAPSDRLEQDPNEQENEDSSNNRAKNVEQQPATDKRNFVQSTCDFDTLIVESWLDDHPNFVRDYFMRKATHQLIDDWLIAHAKVSNTNLSSSVMADLDGSLSRPISQQSLNQWDYHHHRCSQGSSMTATMSSRPATAIDHHFNGPYALPPHRSSVGPIGHYPQNIFNYSSQQAGGQRATCSVLPVRKISATDFESRTGSSLLGPILCKTPDGRPTFLSQSICGINPESRSSRSERRRDRLNSSGGSDATLSCGHQAVQPLSRSRLGSRVGEDVVQMENEEANFVINKPLMTDGIDLGGDADNADDDNDDEDTAGQANKYSGGENACSKLTQKSKTSGAAGNSHDDETAVLVDPLVDGDTGNKSDDTTCPDESQKLALVSHVGGATKDTANTPSTSQQTVTRENEVELIFELVKNICDDLDIRTLLHKILKNIAVLINADKSSLFLVCGAANDPNRHLVSHLFNVDQESEIDDCSSGAKSTTPSSSSSSSTSPARGDTRVRGTGQDKNKAAAEEADEDCIRIPWGTGLVGYVAESGESVNIENCYEDPRFTDAIDQRTGYVTRHMLCAPIYDKRNEIVGVAQVINRRDGKPFTRADELKFQSYLQFCGIGLRNAQSYEHCQLENKRNQVLLDLARIIFEEQSTLEQVVYRIMLHTQSLLECQRCQVLLIDDGSDDLDQLLQLPLNSYGFRKQQRGGSRMENSTNSASGSSSKPQWRPQCNMNPDCHLTEPEPVTDGSQRTSSNKDAHSTTEQGAEDNNKKTIHAARGCSTEMTELQSNYLVAPSSSPSPPISSPKLFSLVFDLECDGNDPVMHSNKQSQQQQQQSPNRQISRGRSQFPINIGITGYVAMTGETLNIEDAHQHERFDPSVDENSDFKHKSILCMPIRNGRRQIIGVSQLINKKNGKPFNKNDEDLFEAFAIFCGLGIHNTLMYERVLKIMAKQRVTFEVLSYHATAPLEEAKKLHQEQVPSCYSLNLASLKFNDFSLDEQYMLKSCLRFFLDLDLIRRFQIDQLVFCNWILSVQKNYRKITYHPIVGE